MANEESQTPLSYDRLVQENLALRQKLENLETERRNIWELMINVNRRLQASSASIKAAVSSLLSYDILWDVANQHEFLKTIDASADQAAQYVMLLSLAFRLLADRLEIKSEAHNLQEILSNVESDSPTYFPNLSLELSMPREGKPVWIDYDYLVIALELFFEVLQSQSGPSKVLLTACEGREWWRLELEGLSKEIVQALQAINKCKLTGEDLAADHVLRLYIVCRLFSLQGIRAEIKESKVGPARLRLLIPLAARR